MDCKVILGAYLTTRHKLLAMDLDLEEEDEEGCV